MTINLRMTWHIIRLLPLVLHIAVLFIMCHFVNWYPGARPLIYPSRAGVEQAGAGGECVVIRGRSDSGKFNL